MHEGQISDVDSLSDYPTIKSSDYPLPIRALVVQIPNHNTKYYTGKYPGKKIVI